MNAIKIREPRYRDRAVLVARYKIGCGQDVTIEILSGAYKGFYKAKNEDVVNSPLEKLKTKNGSAIDVRAIPLDKFERIEA